MLHFVEEVRMKYITATKHWGACACNCGKTIETGSEFAMVSGLMYLRGHEGKATGAIRVIKKDKQGAQAPDES